MKTLASPSQRFVAFLIDSIIVGFVSYLLTLLLMFTFRVKEPVLAKFDSDVKTVLVDIVNDKLSSVNVSTRVTLQTDNESIAIYIGITEDIDIKNGCSGLDSELSTKVINTVADIRTYISQSSRYNVVSSVISFISMLIIVFLYYDVIGYYWSSQTVGRMLFKLKVVDMKGNPPSMPILALRDVVGFALFNLLNVCCGLALILNIIFILRDHVSVGDRLSSTRMVRIDEVCSEEEEDFPKFKKFENNNYDFENVDDAEIVDDDLDDVKIVKKNRDEDNE